MKNKLLATIFVSLLIVSISACTGKNDTNTQKNSSISTSISQSTIQSNDMFTNNDKEIGYDKDSCIEIILNDDSSKCESKSVKINKNIITITDEGSYILTGKLSNGQIVVDAQKSDKVKLILSGVNINSDTSAGIYIKQADKAFITLENETENFITNKNEFISIDDNNIDAAIYAKDDVTLNGLGSLKVNTEYGNGIVSKNDLVITSGKYEINAKKHGISGKDSVRIADGNIVITSGKDGIHSENKDNADFGFIYITNGTLTIHSQEDAISGSKYIQIKGGEFNITTAGGSENSIITENDKNPDNFKEPPQDIIKKTIDETSTKGIKSDGDITIDGGIFKINSLDDAVNSNSNITISNGDFTIFAGDDGIHANEKIIVNNGMINITKSNEGISGKSVDINNGNVQITSNDDGINAAGGNDNVDTNGRKESGNLTVDESCYIKISGGEVNVDAKGDGLDSNGALYIAGGNTYVAGPTDNENAALDFDGVAEITGGIVIATGWGGMMQNFGDTSTQGSMLINSTDIQKGTIILKDNEGIEIVNYTPLKEYNSIVISSPKIIKGQIYEIIIGDETQTIKMTNLIYGKNNQMMNNKMPKGGMKELPKDKTNI